MSDNTSKGNYGSLAMEAILTSADDSAGASSSPNDWQHFLIDTMTAISGPLARDMLECIGLNASAEPFRLLDHGCGLGVVAPVLMETVPQAVLEASSVVCGDNSAALVEAVGRRIEREEWVNCEARVVDAQDSGLPSESFTHVVSNIMFHTVPDSEVALRDSIRLLKPGGILALTTWHACNPACAHTDLARHSSNPFPCKKIPGDLVPMLTRSITAYPRIVHVRDAFATFPVSLLPPDYTFRFPMQTSPWGHWDDVDWVRSALASPPSSSSHGGGGGDGGGGGGGGLEDVHAHVRAGTSRVEGVDHFMRAYGKSVDAAAAVALGAESVARLGGHEGVRRRVRGYLEGEFGGKEEGWTLVWVSICAWGRKKRAEGDLD